MPVTCDTADLATTARQPASPGILLVEDEPAVRKVLSRFLSVKGYQVFAAGDAGAAENVWRSHRSNIGVMVSDVVLPGKVSGRRLATLLQEQKPELEVILTSGFNTELADAAAPANSHTRFLAKPYRPDEMLEMIRAAVSAPSLV